MTQYYVLPNADEIKSVLKRIPFCVDVSPFVDTIANKEFYEQGLFVSVYLFVILNQNILEAGKENDITNLLVENILAISETEE